MKKLLLSLLALLTVATAAQAEVKGVGERAKMFKNLGVSVELGLVHGPGVNLHTTLVDRHLYLMLGYNFPAIDLDADFDIKMDNVRSVINNYNQAVEAHPEYGLSQLTQVNSEESLDVKLTANLFKHFKAMLQYYPSKNSGFHLTGGIMVGDGELFSGTGRLTGSALQTYSAYVDAAERAARDEGNYGKAFEQMGIDPSTRGRQAIADRTYILQKDGSSRFAIEASKVKPYLGIGFGNAIPQEHRVGFNLELGVWYHGDIKLTGDCREATKAEIDDGKLKQDDFDIYNLKVMPTITFRITGRIF